MKQLDMKGKWTGMFDKNNKKIFWFTSILKLPDGRTSILAFDYGQLSSYFADEDGFTYTDLDGVNNWRTAYLYDCEVIDKTPKKIKADIYKKSKKSITGWMGKGYDCFCCKCHTKVIENDKICGGCKVELIWEKKEND